MLSSFFRKWQVIQLWLHTTAKETFRITLFKKTLLSKPLSKVLCIDDDRSFCHYMQRLAYELNIQLDTAYSISAAKKKINENSDYQAFIIDGHLPEGSGFELVAWIREEKESIAPIGFLSRIYQDANSFRILKENFQVDYVLEKPIRPLEVRQLLINLCYLKLSLKEEPFPDAVLTELRESYQKTIIDKIEDLEKMILNVQQKPTIAHMQVLKEEVHKIAGSAGSYGYTAVSKLCKNLEKDLIKQIELAQVEGLLDQQWLMTLDDFFTQIKLHFQMNLLE